MAVVEDTECAVVGRGLVRARLAGEAVAPRVVVVANAARGGEGGYGGRDVKAEAALERVEVFDRLDPGAARARLKVD